MFAILHFRTIEGKEERMKVLNFHLPLIADTTDRQTEELRVDQVDRVVFIVVEVEAESVATIALGSTPEEGGEAEIDIVVLGAAVVAARRQRTEARDIVGTQIIAHSTLFS